MTHTLKNDIELLEGALGLAHRQLFLHGVEEEALEALKRVEMHLWNSYAALDNAGSLIGENLQSSIPEEMADWTDTCDTIDDAIKPIAEYLERDFEPIIAPEDREAAIDAADYDDE